MSPTDDKDLGHPAVVKSTEDLVQLVRTRRHELGLTQAELAGVIGIDRTTLSMFEQGQRTGMSIGHVLRLVQGLGMDIEIRSRRR